MAKKIVQDVLPPENKTIRNIPISRRQDTARSAYRTGTSAPPRTSSPVYSSVHSTQKEDVEDVFEERRLDSRKTDDLVSPPQIPKKKSFILYKSFWFLTFVFLIITAFGVSFFFVSAEIDIKPKTENANLNISLLAKKTSQAGELGFDVVTLSRELGKTVNASEEERVEKKSSGRIVIYNKHSKTSQKLVASTRFENSKGQIYRISEAVTIPGYTLNGTEIVPGSVTVTVYADQSGEAYNSGLSDFTIPGFKGDPRFSSIYARSDTPMQGGFSGMMKKISVDVLEKTEKELEEQIKDQLMLEAKSQIPENYVLFSDAISFDFESMPQSEVSDKSVKINKKGTITGIILDKNLLNSQLAKNTLTPVGAGEVYVSNLEKLTFSLTDSGSILNAINKDIYFVLKGQARFIWTFDQDKLKRDLAGKSKKGLGSALVSYPAIERAKVTLKPFWKTTFPKSVSKISVKINIDE
jgi:hypothetical protein